MPKEVLQAVLLKVILQLLEVVLQGERITADSGLNKGKNMADWFIATEGVKVVKDSASLWPQIITGFSSAGAAFGGVWYGQWRITQREKEAAAAKS